MISAALTMYDPLKPDVIPSGFTAKAETFLAGLGIAERQAEEPLATLARNMRLRTDGVLVNRSGTIAVETIRQFMETNHQLISDLFVQVNSACDGDTLIMGF